MTKTTWPRRALNYVVLPREISAFEATYLARLNRVALVFFALHVPVIGLLAWANGTGPVFATLLAAAIVAGPALTYLNSASPRTPSLVSGVAAMFMGGLLVHVGQGPMQIEMHFYFFALLAMLAVFGNPVVILAAAGTVALHHALAWWVIPKSVFNYEAPLYVVGVHAGFVVLESAATCFIARSFFDNIFGLEAIVRARTTELDLRNRDMRLILDHVTQGFCTIDRDGRPSPERSRLFDALFGVPEPSETVFDVFGKKAPEWADTARVAWDEVTAGLMPLALTLDQMPRDLLVDGIHTRVTYVPIGHSEEPTQFLVVVSDVTASVKRERAERDRRETLHIFERCLSDRGAVSDFFEEGATLVDALTTLPWAAPETSRRNLHTLKGNSAIFGLESLAALCHQLESTLADEGKLSAAQLGVLGDQWRRLTTELEHCVGPSRRVVELDEDDRAELEIAIGQGTPRKTLLRFVHGLKLEPTQRRLEHFAEQAERIARRLDKRVKVHVEANNLRVDPKHWFGFWNAFVHTVRNAVDHGLESPEERVAAQKPSCGRLTLRTCLRDDRFVVEVQDDGRGVDWAKVACKAAELGLVATTEAELFRALLHDGVTTARQITDLSGRGVGLGAVRAAAEALGGRIEIRSHGNQGTCVGFSFPHHVMSPELPLGPPGLETLLSSRPVQGATA